MKLKVFLVFLGLGAIIVWMLTWKKSYTYIFPEDDNQRYFIVNFRNLPESKTTFLKDTIDFRSSRLIVLKNRDLYAKGEFFVELNNRFTQIDPNDKDSNRFKFCYFQNIKNVGFSISDYAKKYDLNLKDEFKDVNLLYDFLYFHLGKECVYESVDFYNDLQFLIMEYLSEQ